MTLYVARHANYTHEIWSGNEELMNVRGTPKRIITVPQLSAEFKPRGLTEGQRTAAAQIFGMVPYGRELIMLPQSVDMGDDEHGKLIGQVGWRPGYSADAAATAYPRRHDDIIMTGTEGPQVTEGYDPQFHLGRYDTGNCRDAKGKWQDDPASMIPFQSVKARTAAEKLVVWEAVEEVLHASPDFGQAFIALDMATIPAPFPGYAKIQGDDAEAIAQMRQLLDWTQLNVGVLLEYEKTARPFGDRPNMIALFEELYAKQIEQAKAQSNLLAGLEVTL